MLSCTEFWSAEEATAAVPTATAVSRELHIATNPDEPVFLWTAGPRALAVFLLRAHAQSHPLDFEFAGGPKSLPQTLAEALRDKQTREGRKTWIQGMFTKASDQAPHQLSSSLFRYRYNPRDGRFFVGLGESWKGADFKVSVNGRFVPSTDYELYADQLEGETEAWEPVVARLDGTVAFLICDCQASRQVPILDHGLPLRTDDSLIVRVCLSEPGFAYLIWITSSGEVQPIHPWVDYQWNRRALDDKVTNLCLPPPDSDGNARCYPLNTKAGLEIVFLLARVEPLPKSFDPTLAQVFQSLGALTTKSSFRKSNSLFHFDYSQDAKGLSRRMRLGSPQTLPNPLARFKTVVGGKLEGEFPVIKAWAFATTGA